MGIYERPGAAFLDALGAEFGFDPPRLGGLDTVDTIGAMRAGNVRVFIGMGGNFASATPDTTVTHAALERCRLTVHVSTKLNMSHLVTGDQALILPTMGRTERHEIDGREQIVTVEDSMGVVHASRGTLRKAAPQLLSEVEIVCAIADALFLDDDDAADDDSSGATPRSTIDWRGFARDHALIRDSIGRVVPGFEDFNAKIAEPGGFVLPHGPRDERTFATADGRAQFTVNELSHAAAVPGTLLLQTIRSHDQYNTTIYGLDDRYRGIHNGRRVVFVAPADLETSGLHDGDIVDLRSVDVDGVERVAPRFRVVAYPTPVGTCAAYYPETNILVPLASTNAAGTPTFKSIPVTLTCHVGSDTS